jgi:hypothetical protein
MTVQIFKNMIKYFFFLIIGSGFCLWVIYSRLFLIRLPRNLNLEISLFFFLIALLSMFISLLYIKKGFFENGNVSKTKLYIIVQTWIIKPILTFFQKSLLIVYNNTLIHEKFPSRFYLWLFKGYEKLGQLLGSNFLILFLFSFLPQIVLALIFFIEVLYFHYLQIFYKSLFLVLISICFNVLILKALFDFALLNSIDLYKYISKVDLGDSIKFELTPEYATNLDAQNQFHHIVQTLILMERIAAKIGKLTEVDQFYTQKIKAFIMLFYFFGWSHIVITYLYNFWLFLNYKPFS